jgi:hypothetical protein
MVIWNLMISLLRNLIPMYMTVILMVVDTQEMLAVRIRAFPVFSRSLQFFCHRHSYQVNQ